jgi:glutathione S-transferase
MTTIYQIAYFPVQARGEPLRMICEEASIPYENDITVLPFSYKNTLFGQMPILRIKGDDSFEIAQHMSIARFLGQVGGLVPSDDKQAAICDMLSISVQDWRSDSYKAYQESVKRTLVVFTNVNEEKKNEYVNGKLKEYLDRYESFLAKNQPNEYFVGNNLTYADVVIFEHLLELSGVVNYTDYPLLKAFVKRMGERPNIAKYLSGKSGKRYTHFLSGWGYKEPNAI